MKVTLVNYTRDALDMLILAKHTRLTLSPEFLGHIRQWSHTKKQEEAEYIAGTIPSCWEFVDYTFIIEDVSRAFTHQFVRTRHGSYAQQSLRVNDVQDFEYVFTDRNCEDVDAWNHIDSICRQIAHVYKKLIGMGQPVEDARGILPTNIATNIMAKFNLRTLAEMARSRTGGRTQSEYRKVMCAMVDEVTKVHPWTELFFFGDKGRDYFKEIEEFAAKEFTYNMSKKNELLKIVDAMRKS